MSGAVVDARDKQRKPSRHAVLLLSLFGEFRHMVIQLTSAGVVQKYFWLPTRYCQVKAVEGSLRPTSSGRSGGGGHSGRSELPELPPRNHFRPGRAKQARRLVRCAMTGCNTTGISGCGVHAAKSYQKWPPSVSPLGNVPLLRYVPRSTQVAPLLQVTTYTLASQLYSDQVVKLVNTAPELGPAHPLVERRPMT